MTIQSLSFGPQRDTMIRKGKALVSATIDPDQVEALDRMATAQRTSRAHLLRQAIDLYLLVNRSATTSSVHTDERDAA